MDRSFAGSFQGTLLVCGFALLGVIAGCGGRGVVAPSSNLASSSNSGASSGGTSNGSGSSTSSGSGNGSTSGGGNGGGSASGGGGGTSSSTGAFLYVGMDDTYGTYYGASLPQTGHASIAGFAIGADGSLQPTPNSPYAGPAQQLAANGGAAIYAASRSTLDVNRINSDGSLTTTATSTAQPLSPSIGIYESLNFDAPAQMLYAVANHGAGDEFFEIYRTGGDGGLTNNGSQQGTVNTFPLYFTADGTRAYEPFCYHLDGRIFGQNIGSDGKLTMFDSKAAFPSLDGGSSSPCPHALAVSPDTKFVSGTLNSATGPQAALGIWSINSDGTLSAVAGSPYPRTAIAEDIAFDPLGRYIAIAAKDGLWIYSFSPGSAPVAVGAPIVAGAIDRLAFNKAGTLLFAVNAAAQTVYVFNFNSSTGVATPAPGSPHTMNLAPYEFVVAER